MPYTEGDKVRTVRAIPRSSPYTCLKPIRMFDDSEALLREIPEGTEGTVVQHLGGLFVSFDEPGIAGRGILPEDVEPAD